MADPVIYRVPDPTKANESVLLRFEWHTEKNDVFSDAAGVPQFDTLLIGFVSAPGQMRSEANVIIERRAPDGTTVRNEHAYQRFAQYVDAFKKGEAGDGLTGTPLDELPGLDHATRAMLKAMGIPTVEALAEMVETAAHSMMGYRKYKTLAKAWLDQRAGAAPLVKLAAELEARDREIAALKATNADILARVAAIEEATKEKPEPGKRKAA